MPQINPIDFSFHLKTGDLLPALKIKLYDGNTSEPFDLTTYTGKFYMALLDTPSTYKINGVSVNIIDAINGEAEYRWAGTDTNTAGVYLFEFRFTASSKTFTVPVFSPGKVTIESKIGDA